MKANNLWNNDIEIQFWEALKKILPLRKNGRISWIQVILHIFLKVRRNYKSTTPCKVGITMDWQQHIGCKSILEPIPGKFGPDAINGVEGKWIGPSEASIPPIRACTSGIKSFNVLKTSPIFKTRWVSFQTINILEPNRTNLLATTSIMRILHCSVPIRARVLLFGKFISIRVSGNSSCKIRYYWQCEPKLAKIRYIDKIDFLKSSGVIQGFWSLNLNPCIPELYQSELRKKAFKHSKPENRLQKVVRNC